MDGRSRERKLLMVVNDQKYRRFQNDIRIALENFKIAYLEQFVKSFG